MLTAKYPKITINIVNAPPKTWLFIISEYGDARPETIKKMTEHTALSIENVEPEKVHAKERASIKTIKSPSKTLDQIDS
mgnify:CR=1 FL=1